MLRAVVTVIIPTFNRENLIEFTLNSLQAIEGIEVIVVDDGGTDNTSELISSHFCDVRYYWRTKAGGSAARNFGLSKASGKYILYLDSDDLVEADFFDSKIEYLEENRGCSAVYGPYDYFTSIGAFKEDDIEFKHKYPFQFKIDASSFHLRNYMGGNFIPPSAILWRKDRLLEIGGHDEQLLVNQDVELIFNACSRKKAIEAVQKGGRALIRDHQSDQRVGAINGFGIKLEQILCLRKKYYNILLENNIWDREMNLALAEYCFNFWRIYRFSHPKLAGEFLAFSKKLHPGYTLKGGLIIKILSQLVGPVRATHWKYKLLKRD